jgi:hypothetical protein
LSSAMCCSRYSSDELVHSQLAAGEGAKTDALQGVLEERPGPPYGSFLTGREASAAATVAVRVVVTEAPKAVALVAAAHFAHRRSQWTTIRDDAAATPRQTSTGSLGGSEGSSGLAREAVRRRPALCSRGRAATLGLDSGRVSRTCRFAPLVRQLLRFEKCGRRRSAGTASTGRSGAPSHTAGAEDASIARGI